MINNGLLLYLPVFSPTLLSLFFLDKRREKKEKNGHHDGAGFFFLSPSIFFFRFPLPEREGQKKKFPHIFFSHPLLLTAHTSYIFFHPRAIYQQTPPCSLRLTLSILCILRIQPSAGVVGGRLSGPFRKGGLNITTSCTVPLSIPHVPLGGYQHTQRGFSGI